MIDTGLGIPPFDGGHVTREAARSWWGPRSPPRRLVGAVVAWHLGRLSRPPVDPVGVRHMRRGQKRRQLCRPYGGMHDGKLRRHSHNSPFDPPGKHDRTLCSGGSFSAAGCGGYGVQPGRGKMRQTVLRRFLGCSTQCAGRCLTERAIPNILRTSLAPNPPVSIHKETLRLIRQRLLHKSRIQWALGGVCKDSSRRTRTGSRGYSAPMEARLQKKP